MIQEALCAGLPGGRNALRLYPFSYEAASLTIMLPAAPGGTPAPTLA